MLPWSSITPRKAGTASEKAVSKKHESPIESIDCLILSGGGAKGAYGAGAAKALYAFRKLRGLTSGLCLIGTSAGALNACTLAAFGPDRLIDFWKEVTPYKILGLPPRSPLWRLLFTLLLPHEWALGIARQFGAQIPYSLYSNRNLRRFLEESLADLDFAEFKLKTHLILAATNYSRGTLEAFFVSHLLDQFKTIDQQKLHAQQRIGHFTAIADKDMLIDSLLASASIPFAFPPVKISESWYVDGGVGNNTPAQEAALFLRYVNEHPDVSKARYGEVFCVMQDPPGTVAHSGEPFGAFGILSRTYDLFHFSHMLPIIKTWHQINRSVMDHMERVSQFHNVLAEAPIDDKTRQMIVNEFDSRFGKLRGALERLSIDYHEVLPSAHLGNVLDFGKGSIASYIDHGYTDMVQMLRDKDRIDDTERSLLLLKIHDPVGD